MPIPQLEPIKKSDPEFTRDASAIRKKRAAERADDNSAGHFKSKTVGGPNGSTGPKDNNSKKRPEEKAAKPKKLKKKKAGTKPGKPGKKNTKTRKWLKRIIKLFIVLFILGLIAVVAAITTAYFWVSKDLADITDIERRAIAQSTKIYARDGETLLYEIGDNKRQDVSLEEISDLIEQATVALEDRNFYNHKGVSITGIMRAAIANALNRDTGQGGASTLTQQFIKNAILTPEQTYTRKIKEAILAMRLEQKYSKDEILNMYINEVYYGANYQGAEVSAQGFFGKSANEVSLAEAATLAALPQNPPLLINSPDRLLARRNYAIEQMAELGFITEDEADEAKEVELNIQDEVTEINAPHFVFYVRAYLEEKYGQNSVRKGGLKVTTTLDWEKQIKAEQAVTDGMAKIEEYGGSNAALISMDAHTGQVLAMVGSRDYFDEANDGQVNVTTSLRQPGSSFKPLVYLAAFEKGYTPDTRVFDLFTRFPTDTGSYEPKNYDLSSRGAVTLRSALGQSLNITAVKVLYLVGVDNALNMAERLGYTSFGDRSRFGLALVLGGGEVTLLEHTAAFGAFAREGEYRRPATILKVEDRDGDILEEWVNEPQLVVDTGAARTLNSVLSDQGARAGFTALNLEGRAVAAKTGTTNDYRDAWTIGYTPSYVTGVWAGNNDNSEMNRGAAGLIIAAPLWNAYMESILGDTPAESFNTASYSAANAALGGMLEKTITKPTDRLTGELIPDECANSYPPDYIVQKEFKEAHSLLYWLDKDNPTGAMTSTKSDDAMLSAWESAVIGWSQAESNAGTYLSDSTPKADCDLRNAVQQPTVTIRSVGASKSYSKKDLSLSASVVPGSGRIITSVEFYIDVVLVDSQNVNVPSAGNVYSSYKPKTLTEGRHDLTIRVTDDKGNVAEDTTRFNYKD